MSMKNNLFGWMIIGLSIITACSNDQEDNTMIRGNDSIKSITSGGKTSSKFIYNNLGKIAEEQNLYFYKKHIYDGNGRLIKEEKAFDSAIYASTYQEKNELMTAENSTISGYSIFEYNQEAKLKTIKNYNKKNAVFEYSSMMSLEYDGANIAKRNLYNAENNITNLYAYEYDNSGNVIKEKYYSYLFIQGLKPKLISEVSYQYDDKNNPFKIYKDLGYPGLFTNTNNIIESNSTLYEEVPGIDKYVTNKTTYEYNEKGFPVRIITKNSEHEYRYE